MTCVATAQLFCTFFFCMHVVSFLMWRFIIYGKNWILNLNFPVVWFLYKYSYLILQQCSMNTQSWQSLEYINSLNKYTHTLATGKNYGSRKPWIRIPVLDKIFNQGLPHGLWNTSYLHKFLHVR